MSEASILERKFDPLYQAAFVLAVALVINILAMLVRSTDAVGVGNRFPWLIAAAMMLFYAMVNVILSVSSQNLMRYWGRSIYAFMGVALGAGLLAWAFSQESISQAGSYKWIYAVVTFCYLVFLGMITMMRKVVEFAQKEEWNSPKIRQKKRR